MILEYLVMKLMIFIKLFLNSFIFSFLDNLLFLSTFICASMDSNITQNHLVKWPNFVYIIKAFVKKKAKKSICLHMLKKLLFLLGFRVPYMDIKGLRKMAKKGQRPSSLCVFYICNEANQGFVKLFSKIYILYLKAFSFALISIIITILV